jgi:hypothetical protein
MAPLFLVFTIADPSFKAIIDPYFHQGIFFIWLESAIAIIKARQHRLVIL